MRSIIYLVRSTMQNAQLIAQQVKATNRCVGVLQKWQARVRDEEQAALRQLNTVRTVRLMFEGAGRRASSPHISLTLHMLRAC